MTASHPDLYALAQQVETHEARLLDVEDAVRSHAIDAMRLDAADGSVGALANGHAALAQAVHRELAPALAAIAKEQHDQKKRLARLTAVILSVISLPAMQLNGLALEKALPYALAVLVLFVLFPELGDKVAAIVEARAAARLGKKPSDPPPSEESPTRVDLRPPK